MHITELSYQQILDSLYDGLYITDTNRTIIYWNKAAETITGFSADEIIGKRCSDNVLNHIDENGTKLCLSKCPLSIAMKQALPQETSIYLHHKNGQRIPVNVRVSPLFDEHGTLIGAVELFSNCSKQKNTEILFKEMEKLALIDTLTQIPNRRFLEKQLLAAFDEIKRFHIPSGFIFVDIDNFKTINDTYGHTIGDRVLKFVAATLQNITRTFDTAARWGGDEFALIIHNITTNSLSEIANRIRILIENSFLIHDFNHIGVTISAGATMIQEDDTIESLISRADKLLYTSKNSGKNLLTLN